MIEKKIYFFNDFCKLLNIPSYQKDRRKQDLLAWLKEFFDYNILGGKPLRIEILEQYGEYKPLPRKIAGYTLEEKLKDYEAFTIAALGTEYKPNSKSKIAREAICSFGEEKYGHTSTEGVTRRFVKPAFGKYGETNDIHVWVWYTTYEPIDKKALQAWRKILKEEHIAEEEAANAFYKQQQGEDITKERKAFEYARIRFEAEYGEKPPILVKEWRANLEKI